MDITRDIFDPSKRYAGHRYQQGRVSTDDDGNEAARIIEHAERENLVQLVGPRGTGDDGFRISNPQLVGDELEFDIGPGTYYLDGIRAHGRSISTYRRQPDWLDQPTNARRASLKGSADLIYLEVWRQDVTATEDAEILEPALGGVDTGARVRTMWRVRVEKGVPSQCRRAWQTFRARLEAAGWGTLDERGRLRGEGRLSVGFPAPVVDDPCRPGPSAGAINQLLRVQTLDPGRFTWGLDNAAPLYRVTRQPAGSLRTLRLNTLPRDEDHLPRSGDTVEILSTTALLDNGEAIAAPRGLLRKLDVGFRAGADTVELDADLPAGFETGADGVNHPLFLRIWRRGDALAAPAEIPYVAGTPVALGDLGLELNFSAGGIPPESHWLVALRAETPGRTSPWSLSEAAGRAPHGRERIYAPLALLRWSGAGAARTPVEFVDCRSHFRPLTAARGCALDLHPDEDWRERLEAVAKDTAIDRISICFAPGTYSVGTEGTVTIRGKRSVKVTGAGAGTLLVAERLESLLSLEACDEVIVRDVSLRVNGRSASEERGFSKHVKGALHIEDARVADVSGVRVRTAAAPRVALAGIVARGDARSPRRALEVRIHGCVVTPGAQQVGILVVDAARAEIVGNHVGRGFGQLPKQGRLDHMLADTGYRRRVERLLFDPLDRRRDDALSVNFQQRTISFRSWAPFSKRVSAYLHQQIRSAGDAVPATSDIAFAAWLQGRMVGALSRSARQPFGAEARRQLERNRPPAASCGIVVAGRESKIVHIARNHVQDTRGGIRVALSHERLAPLIARRVRVDDNTIRVLVTAEGLRAAHYGVLIGHAEEVGVTSNAITSDRKGFTRGLDIPVTGIRVFGRQGPRRRVDHNDIEGVGTGLHLVHLPGSTARRAGWTETGNVFTEVTTEIRRG